MLPYHRLAVNDKHRWWRPLLGSLLVLLAAVAVQIAVFTVAWIVGLVAGRPTDPYGMPILPDAVNTALTLISVALALPIALATARLIQRRPAGTLSSVVGRLRWGWMARCSLILVPTMSAVIAASIGLVRLTEGDSSMVTRGAHWPGVGAFLAAAAMLLALVPLQAAAEEYVFRGWLLQAVGAYTRSPWPAIVLPAFLFSLAHGIGTPWGFADLVALGVVAGWLTVRTGGLESAIALHVVNNVAWLLYAAANGMFSIKQTAADMPWQYAVVAVAALAGYAGAVSWLARRRGLETSAPVASAAASASDTAASMRALVRENVA